MRRIAIIFSTLLVFMTAMGQIKNKGNARGNSSGAPDFAYPEKVEAAALKDIDSALKRGDGPATVNAMVRLGLAKAAPPIPFLRFWHRLMRLHRARMWMW